MTYLFFFSSRPVSVPITDEDLGVAGCNRVDERRPEAKFDAGDAL